MEWYWWVLIGVGAVFVGYVKLKVLGKIMENRKARAKAQELLDD